jgi:transcriptional regulator with XRE-family HTH domain
VTAKAMGKPPFAYPSSAEVPYSEGWLKTLRAAQERKGWDQKTLAREAGVDPSAITQLYQGVYKSSNLPLKLRGVLDADLPPPVALLDDADDALWAILGHVLKSLDRRQYRRVQKRVLALVESALEFQQRIEAFGEDLESLSEDETHARLAEIKKMAADVVALKALRVPADGELDAAEDPEQ